jgi:hypothetical protein
MKWNLLTDATRRAYEQNGLIISGDGNLPVIYNYSMELTRLKKYVMQVQ